MAERKRSCCIHRFILEPEMFWLENLKGRDHSEDLDVDEK